MDLQNTAGATRRSAGRKPTTSVGIPTLNEAGNLAGRARAIEHHTGLSAAPIGQELRGLPTGPGPYLRLRGMRRRSQVREAAR